MLANKALRESFAFWCSSKERNNDLEACSKGWIVDNKCLCNNFTKVSVLHLLLLVFNL